MSVEVIKTGDTDTISCSNCLKALMIIGANKRTSDEVISEIVVVCPFCGDKSFKYPLYGPMKNLPAKGVQLLNCKLDNNIMTFTTKKV